MYTMAAAPDCDQERIDNDPASLLAARGWQAVPPGAAADQRLGAANLASNGSEEAAYEGGRIFHVPEHTVM
jgi:hypothetical protein